MSCIEKYKDIIAFHPGHYVEEAIQDMNISQSKFAKRLGVSERTLSLFIDGQIDVSYNLARRLSMVLGTSIKFWFNLQSIYYRKMTKIWHAEYIDKHKKKRSFNYGHN